MPLGLLVGDIRPLENSPGHISSHQANVAFPKLPVITLLEHLGHSSSNCWTYPRDLNSPDAPKRKFQNPRNRFRTTLQSPCAASLRGYSPVTSWKVSNHPLRSPISTVVGSTVPADINNPIQQDFEVAGFIGHCAAQTGKMASQKLAKLDNLPTELIVQIEELFGWTPKGELKRLDDSKSLLVGREVKPRVMGLPELAVSKTSRKLSKIVSAVLEASQL